MIILNKFVVDKSKCINVHICRKCWCNILFGSYASFLISYFVYLMRTLSFIMCSIAKYWRRVGYVVFLFFSLYQSIFKIKYNTYWKFKWTLWSRPFLLQWQSFISVFKLKHVCKTLNLINDYCMRTFPMARFLHLILHRFKLFQNLDWNKHHA